MQWKKKDQRPEQLMHKVYLVGAKPPRNFFHLTLNPTMEGSSSYYTKYSQRYKLNSWIHSQTFISILSTLRSLSILHYVTFNFILVSADMKISNSQRIQLQSSSDFEMSTDGVEGELLA